MIRMSTVIASQTKLNAEMHFSQDLELFGRHQTGCSAESLQLNASKTEVILSGAPLVDVDLNFLPNWSSSAPT